MSIYSKEIIRNILIILTIIGLSLTDAQSEEWRLKPEQSSLNYLSSKLIPGSLTTIFEKNKFEKFSGRISNNNEAHLIIDMASVNTGIEIRNQRIMEHVFLTKQYPQAELSLKLPNLENMAPVSDHKINAILSMRGKQQNISTIVRISQLTDLSGKKQLLVQNITPVLIKSEDYQMQEGFEKLREIAKLFKIPTTIPVNFSFLFVSS